MAAFVQVADLLPDGVHLGLADAEYFGQNALGSTDLIRLHRHRWGWWWSSRHNPDFREQSSPARTYGQALHAIMLEGLTAYETRFAVQPERPGGAIDTIDEMRHALTAGQFSLQRTSGWAKDDWRLAMRQNLPRVRVWSNMLEDFAERAGERPHLTAVEDRMLRFMASVAVDPDRPDNAEIRTLFAGGGDYPPLAEVSILHTLRDGTRRRWRIDRMFPRFDLDLKSLGNWSGRPLKWATGDIIAARGYDIQRADYWRGRRVAYDYIRAGKVYGGTPEERRWLRRFPDEFPEYDWVWLFYQKPEAVGRAPILFPIWDDSWNQIDPRLERPAAAVDVPGLGWCLPSPLRTYGQNKADKALSFYREAVRDFGLDRPWARVEPLHYADDAMLPSISLPSWIADDEPHEETAYGDDDTEN